jgi:ATP-dependent RNA helicase RhlE
VRFRRRIIPSLPPIQTRAIPALLSGRDLLGIAQTGTGKTAAFGIPLLQKLSVGHVPPQPKQAKALILAPTRELAVQIEESLRTYGRFLNLKLTVILGGREPEHPGPQLCPRASISWWRHQAVFWTWCSKRHISSTR